MSFRPRSIALALGALLLLGADSPTKTLDIYFIDVMGGAATLIVTPERESLLIDSGWAGFGDRDPKRIVHVLKDVAGLDHLDHLVTTHWHSDHFGGVDGLARLRADRPLLGPRAARPAAADGDKADFPDGPRPDDPLGIAYRKAAEGKRQALQAGDALAAQGGRGRRAGLGRRGDRRPRGPPNPALCRGPARPEARPHRQRPQPGLPVPARQVRLPRLRRPDLERRESSWSARWTRSARSTCIR